MTSKEQLCESVVAVEVPPQFGTYVAAALLRVQAQYPSCRFAEDGEVVTIRSPVGTTEDELRKSILHAVYREKVYAETLSMRQALIAAVTAR
jgi:hypothetical protein